MSVEYKEGSHQSFIEYLYSAQPKQRGEIQLESDPLNSDKNIGLHIFEQLLMIFVDGLKYFYSDTNGKVDISNLREENITKINEYFRSMNYEIKLEVFQTMYEYQFKYPNYFKNQQQITQDTKLEDFYYEIFNNENTAFRISFKYSVN